MEEGRKEITDARLDAISWTSRGIPPDVVLDWVKAFLPYGSVYKGSAGIVKGKIVVPDENPVKWRTQGGDCFVSVMGPLAQVVQRAGAYLSQKYPGPVGEWPQRVRVSRVDGCRDQSAPGLFKRLQAHALILADRFAYRGVPLSCREVLDRARPDAGVTQYLGKAPVFGRIYEKGKQLRDVYGVPDADLHLVRVEVQCAPENAAAFDALTWSGSDVLRTHRPTLALLSECLEIDVPEFLSTREAGTRSTLVRSLVAASNQYGGQFRRLVMRLGDVEAAGRVMAGVLLQANPSPQSVMDALEGGISVPELSIMASGLVSSEQHAA